MKKTILLTMLLVLFTITSCVVMPKYPSSESDLPVGAKIIRTDGNGYTYFVLGSRFYVSLKMMSSKGYGYIIIFEVDKEVASLSEQ